MRGSPNTILEAINCCLPVVITDALPGQEAGNPEYFEENMLGCFAHNIKDIKETVKNLLDNDAQKLMEIKEHQAKFRNPGAAKEIAERYGFEIEDEDDIWIFIDNFFNIRFFICKNISCFFQKRNAVMIFQIMTILCMHSERNCTHHPFFGHCNFNIFIFT